MTLRESLVTVIEFCRIHGQEEPRVQRACKALERKAERLRRQHEQRYATIEIDPTAPTTLSRQQVIMDFRGGWCRACNGKKEASAALCFRCHQRLAAPTRKALTLRFGEGFEQAYERALSELGSTTTHP